MASWVSWGAGALLVALFQIVLSNPHCVITLLTACARAAGLCVFRVSNDRSPHIELTWLETFLCRHARCFNRRLVSLPTDKMRAHGEQMDRLYARDASTEPVALQIGSGPFWLRRAGHVAVGLVSYPPSESLPWSDQRHQPMSILICSFSRAAAERLFLAARDEYNARVHPPHRLRCSVAMVTNWWAWWKPADLPPVSASELLRTDEMLRFERDVGEFVHSCRGWMTSRHKHKRSMLIYGTPGGGKTLFAKAMAAEHSLQLYDLNLGCGRVDDLALQMLLSSLSPQPKMLIIDEFDVVSAESRRWRMGSENAGSDDDDDDDGSGGAFGSGTRRERKQPSKAGWNRLLDGDAADNIIVVLITNRTERELTRMYGDSFMRARRIDRIYHFGQPDARFTRALRERYRLSFEDATTAHNDLAVAGASVADAISAAEMVGDGGGGGSDDLRMRGACFRRHLRAVVTRHRARCGAHDAPPATETLCRALDVADNERISRALTKQHIHSVAPIVSADVPTLREMLSLSIGDSAQLSRALNCYEERREENPDTTEWRGWLAEANQRMYSANFPATTMRRLRRALCRCGKLEDVKMDGRVLPHEWHKLSCTLDDPLRAS